MLKFKKRRLFQKKKTGSGSGQVALQITSMADIFTILLVFLLKGISSDAIQISPSNGTSLPSGLNTVGLDTPALQVEISKEALLVEKEFVLSLEGLVIQNQYLQQGLIGPLNERLSKERERQELIAKTNPEISIDSKVVLISDREIPFGTLKPILRTLSANGYSEIKLAVITE